MFAGRSILEIQAASPVEAMRLLDDMDEVEKTSIFGTAVHAVLKQPRPGAAERLRQHLAAAGVEVFAIDRVQPSLEDVFLEVAGQRS